MNILIFLVFLDEGLNVNKILKGKTLLMYSVIWNKIEFFELLLSKKADPNFEIKNNPLHVACKKGYIDMVHRLIECGVDIHQTDKYHQTPLLLATTYGHEAIVQILLELKVDPNIPDKAGYAPLHLACQKGHTKIIALLIKFRADPNIRDQDGATPLHFVNNNIEIIHILLSNGADPNIP